MQQKLEAFKALHITCTDRGSSLYVPQGAHDAIVQLPTQDQVKELSPDHQEILLDLLVLCALTPHENDPDSGTYYFEALTPTALTDAISKLYTQSLPLPENFTQLSVPQKMLYLGLTKLNPDLHKQVEASPLFVRMRNHPELDRLLCISGKGYLQSYLTSCASTSLNMLLSKQVPDLAGLLCTSRALTASKPEALAAERRALDALEHEALCALSPDKEKEAGIVLVYQELLTQWSEIMERVAAKFDPNRRGSLERVFLKGHYGLSAGLYVVPKLYQLASYLPSLLFASMLGQQPPDSPIPSPINPLPMVPSLTQLVPPMPHEIATDVLENLLVKIRQTANEEEQRQHLHLLWDALCVRGGAMLLTYPIQIRNYSLGHAQVVQAILDERGERQFLISNPNSYRNTLLSLQEACALFLHHKTTFELPPIN